MCCGLKGPDHKLEQARLDARSFAVSNGVLTAIYKTPGGYNHIAHNEAIQKNYKIIESVSCLSTMTT